MKYLSDSTKIAGLNPASGEGRKMKWQKCDRIKKSFKINKNENFVNYNLARGGSTMAGPLPREPKFKGSNPGTSDTERK